MFNNYFNQYARPQRYSKAAYQKHMVEIWEENALCIKNVIDYSMSDSNAYSQVIDRLRNNLRTIADTFIRIYGDRDLIVQLFNNICNVILMSIDCIRWKKELSKSRAEWYRYIDSLISHLHEFVDSNVRQLFYKQMRLVESLIEGFLKKNNKMSEYCYSQLLTNNRVLGMTMFNGLVNNNKTIFV